MNRELICLAAFGTLLCIGAVEDYWYEGCYEDSTGTLLTEDLGIVTDSGDSWRFRHNESVSVVECCRMCYTETYKFAAVKVKGQCQCYNTTQRLTKVQETGLCAPRQISDGVAPLNMGQSNSVWSVYKSDGPYIVNTSVVIDTRWVVKDIPVAIEIVTHLAGFRNVSKDKEIIVTPLLLSINLTMDNITKATSVNAEGTTIYGRIQHVFTEAGNHSLSVNVSNSISQWEEDVIVYVIESEPRDLQVVPVIDPASSPSCVPASYGNIQGKTTVFKNMPFLVEASLAVGRNVTFEFQVAGFSKPFIQKPERNKSMHTGQECSGVEQSVVLENLGEYQVTVTAYNQYGQVQKNLSLVVMEDVLADPSFSLTPGSKTLVVPEQPLAFLVTMEIRSRIGGTLQVDFSDGDVHTAGLEDTNSTSFALNCDQGEMVVSASYGQGCILHVQFDHAFQQEGLYNPRISIYNDNMTISKVLETDITVVKPLQGAVLQGNRYALVNMSTEFVLDFSSLYVNVSYRWLIMDTNKMELDNFTSALPKMSYIFPQKGEYIVMARAKNLLGEIKASTYVNIQEPLGDLHVTCGDKTFIRTEEVIQCTATLEQGIALFTWLSKPDNGQRYSRYIGTNTTSVTEFWFDNPGDYNISVIAYNGVQRQHKRVPMTIHVQEPIVCVSIENYNYYNGGVVLLGNLTKLITTIKTSSDVQLEFDFNNMGRQTLEHAKSQTIKDFVIYLTYYNFNKHALHNVTVHAMNKVSKVQHSVKVLVQRPVPAFEVKVVGFPTVGRHTAFHILTSGEPIDQEDLTYQWTFDRSTTLDTGSSVIFYNFTSPGIHLIQVTVYNFVHQQTEALEIIVEEGAGWYVDHEIVVSVNTTVNFTVQGVSDIQDTEVNFGDGTTKRFHGDKWSHQYSSAGIYSVTITRGEKVEESLVLVQEKITGLKLIGTDIVEIEHCLRQFRSFMWGAEEVTGTDILYTWSLQGRTKPIPKSITAYNKFFKSFEASDIYNLTLEAWNYVSYANVSMTIRVLHPVVEVKVRSRPVPLGKPSSINVTIDGGQDVTIFVDFGDGSSTEISTKNESTDMERFYTSTRSNRPIYVVRILHEYFEIGAYKVTVNVSNLISSVDASCTVDVGTPITGIKLHTDSPRIFDISEAVVVTATVETGDDITFEWDFSDRSSSHVVSDKNSSTATHNFYMASEFKVSVAVSNYLYQRPLVETLNMTFLPMEEITGELFLTIDNIANIAGPKQEGVTLEGAEPDIKTKEIVFGARIYRGSNISMTFDFGDGTKKSVNGFSDFLNVNVGRVTHRYTKEGAYNVSATASNAISNVTAYLEHLFYVERAPVRAQLNTTQYTKFGDVTTLYAYITGGTDLIFDWKFDDQTDEINNAGPVVNHTFKAAGVYDVTVTGRNKAANKSRTITVFVQHEIQGVELTASSVLSSSTKPINFKAKTFPHFAEVTYFEWNFGKQNDHVILTVENRRTEKFLTPKKYIVTVTARNAVSKAESAPIEVVIQIQIAKLEITHDSYLLVNRSVEFSAYYFKGSDMIFVWNFGDDSENVTTINSKIHHNYTRIAEYKVTLMAYNLLSSETVSKTIFVLDKKCHLPEFKIHGNKDIRTIYRSMELYIEAERQSVSCDITNITLFEWQFYNFTTNKPIVLTRVNRDVLHRRIILIPPRTLDYGTYRLEVKLRAKGTIVYAKKKIFVIVEKSPLIPNIKGGIYRTVKRDGVILLDGSDSRNLDSEHQQANLRYNWTCSIDYLKPCFRENLTDVIVTDRPVMRIEGSWLSEVQDFIIELTVWLPDRPPQNTSQVLHVINDRALELSLYCPQCEQELTNSNHQLSLQVVCMNCEEELLEGEEVQYEWKVERLPMDTAPNSSPVRAHDNGQCVVSGGSSYMSIVKYDALKNKTADLRGNEQTPPGRERLNSRGQGETKNHTFLSPPQIDVKEDMTSQPNRQRYDPIPPPFYDIEESTDNRGRQDTSKTINDPYPPQLPQISEGHPGQSGSSGARGSGGYSDPIEGNGGSRPNPDESGSGSDRRKCTAPSCDDVMPDVIEFPKPSRSHILFDSSMWSAITVDLTNLTKTGLNQRSLVIKPGTLLQGWIYILSVTAKGGKLSGEAKAKTTVNESPSRGDCTVNPASGTEMETEFNVFCWEWKDEHVPLRYEVSYNLQQEDARYLIYRGLQPSIKFRLPAGEERNEYKVYVYIAILDALWGRTPVCFIPITVLPKSNIPASLRPEDLIYYETYNKAGSIAQAQQHGDHYQSKVLVLYLATRLNRLLKSDSEQANQMRINIRERLLSILANFPIRNELEILQNLQALVALTDAQSELRIKEFAQATEIFSEVLVAAKRLYNVSLTPSEDILTLAVKAASNIISSDLEPPPSSPENADYLKVYRYLKTNTLSSIDTLHELLKNELLFHTVGEQPIRRLSPFVSALAASFSTRSKATLGIDQSVFTLPQDMNAVLKAGKSLDQFDRFSPFRDCYQVHMTKLRKNPYTFLAKQEISIQSDVGSLDVYNCKGEQVKVSELHSNNLVSMEIPIIPYVSEESNRTYVLDKSHMNIHRFNVSMENSTNQSFHVVVDLTPVSQGRLFPITFLIGFKQEPTPERYLWKREFDIRLNTLKVFFPAGHFNKSGTYHLGIVDSRYNAGRPRPGEVTQRNYTVKMWWTKCVYWKESIENWSDDGCHSTDQSTYYVTSCRCNHLTSFGSHFELIPNELTFIPVNDFFPLNENPVTISLIATILCLYAVVMVICFRADLHDIKKGGINYLQDNTITDRQNYEVTIETGFRKGAGTTAKISIILHGEEGMSETRELLSEDHKPLFERNSRDKFIITLPDSIGKIWKVQVWHNNFGSSPSWYLSRVIVRDLNTGNMYYFLSEKWLAVEEEDGKVEREFLALEGSLNITTVFWAKGTQYLADYHLWTSLFTRPSYSRFTRIQRLTCGLTTLMMYMCLNAMWYHRSFVEYRGEFGLLDVSWRSLTVGAICCAVIIPVNLFLAFLFRRSKLHSSDTDIELQEEVEKENTVYPSGKPDELGPDDDEEDNPVQPVMTYSILDQSILNWPSIQDWAQKQWVKRQHSVMSIEETTSGKTTVTTTNPPASVTLTPTQVLHKRVIGSETDQASSGFEDSNSTDPRPQMTISSQASSIKYKAPSVSSTASHKSSAVLSTKRKRRFFMPFWSQYVAWTLCILITLGCAVVTIGYGFRFGYTKSIMWLQSLYFSFMVCVFISNPVLIFLAALYAAIRHRHDPAILDHFEDGNFGEKAKLEIMRRKKEKAKETPTEQEEIERGVAARQRSRYLRFARPPQEKQLIEARKKIMKEKKALTLVSNVFGFGLMFFLLCVMAYGKDMTSSFYINDAIKNALMRSGEYENVRLPGDWYTWSQTTMLDVLFSKQTQVNGVKKNFALHGSSYVIGKVQIRQLKVSEEPCQVQPHLPYVPDICHYGYGSNNKRTDVLWEFNQTWRESSSYYTLFGKHGIYDNSGYLVKLEKDRSKALAQLKTLQKYDWIDEGTRAIITEFTLFNPPTNIFSSVALLLELPPTGGADTDLQVSSTYLYRYMSPFDNFILACELAFIVLTLYKVKNEVCTAIKLKRQYFTQAWNIIGGILTVLSLGFIACYVYRFALVMEAVEAMRSTYFEQFVDMSFIALWDYILRVQVGLILFLVLVKSLRLLRYNKLLALFGNVYRRAHRELIIFSGLFFGLLMAFSSLGHALFGSLCYNFRDFWSGVFTMTVVLSGSYKLSETQMPVLYFTRMFIFFFCVFASGLLVSYVIAFLSLRFRISKRKQGDTLTMNGQQALRFYWEWFLLWTGIKYDPPVHETDNVLPPEFTMAEIEYQVDELFFRINALSGSHSLPEKPMGYLTDSDGTYGGGDDGISSGGSEVHQVDDDRLDHRVQQIEEYLCSQELYLAHILKKDCDEQDNLTKQKEKQLKSQLEMEIFRQLQIQRHDAQPDSSQQDAMKEKYTDGDMLKNGWAYDTRNEDSQGSSVPPGDVDSSLCDTVPSSNPESPSETLKTTHSTNSPEKSQDQMAPCKLSDHSDKSGSFSSDSEKGLSSKGKQYDLKAFKKPEPPPKPNFIRSGVRDVAESSRPGLLGSPALRQLRSSLNTIERLSFRGENSGSSVTTESSSGSEQDAIHGMQRPVGKRNLRKTKSRGKGKGFVNLTGSLLDELEYEANQDFEFEAEEDINDPVVKQDDVITEINSTFSDSTDITAQNSNSSVSSKDHIEKSTNQDACSSELTSEERSYNSKSANQEACTIEQTDESEKEVSLSVRDKIRAFEQK